jgi:siroheme synthase-like protein
MPRPSDRNDCPPSRFAYPVFLDLHDVAVLVVGGGRVGARKAEGLVAAGARVRLVAKELSEHLAGISLDEVHEVAFAENHLHGMRLVITATGDAEVDNAVSAAAKRRGIWTNAVDQPVDCDFILPAIARSGRVTAALSTDGASPTLAQELRDAIAGLLSPAIGELASELAAERAAMKTRGESTEDFDWVSRIGGAVSGAAVGNILAR